MNINKITLILLIVACAIIIIGSTCAANSTNERLVEDFAKAMQHANVYRETVLSETGEPVEIVLTVYEQPVVIDYFYGSMDEVDFSVPEAVLLSRLSESTLEWFEKNRDIVELEENKKTISDGLFEFSITNMEDVNHYIVGKVELAFNGTDYVIYKLFRVFHDYDVEFCITFTAERTSSRWKLKDTTTSDLEYCFTTVKVPIFIDILTGKFYSNVYEIQQVYNNSYMTGVFDPSVLREWLEAVGWNPETTFNLMDVISTSHVNEFKLSQNGTSLSYSDWNQQLWSNYSVFVQALMPKITEAREKLDLSD